MHARMRRLGAGCAVVICALASPAVARAATIANQYGTLTLTDPSGTDDEVSVDEIAGQPGRVRVHATSAAPITVTGCSGAYLDYECGGVTLVRLDGGAGSDQLTINLRAIPAYLDGGPGNDRLWNVAGGTISLSGGAGDDVLRSASGALISGGTGIDLLSVEPVEPELEFSVSLDGLPNDGLPEQLGNVLSDVEDVSLESASHSVALSGDEHANRLWAGIGNDTLTGGGGNDDLHSGAGVDTVYARDGFEDRVDCGSGTDAAFADQFDTVSDSCEAVLRETVAPAVEDRPPVIVLATDSTGALVATVSDDRGVASVRFLDDDKALCTVTAAPYVCAYRPGMGDVGANTITAIATDTAGQTASVRQTRVVARFKPRSLSLQVARRGHRYVGTGRLRLPSGIACAGRVTLRGAGRQATALVSRTCTFRAVISSASRHPRFRASYAGTAAIAPITSSPRSPR